jgi:hypothetical protein
MVTANSTNFANAWTASNGTIKIIRDGTTLGNVTTLPTVVSGQYVYSWPLSGSEMTADEVIVQVVDRTNVTDQAFRIITLPDGALRSRLAQAGNATTITLDSSAVATNDYYNGSIVAIIAGTGNAQARVITAYVGSTKVATVDTNWATNPSTDSVFAIYPQGIYGLTSAQVQSSVTTSLTSYNTSTLTQAQAQTASANALTAYSASTLTQAQAQSAAAAALSGYGASTLTQAQAQAASASALSAYGASTLTSAQVETAVMDTANGVETGLTMRQAMRVTAAMISGVRTGVGTTTEVYRSAVSNSTARVTFTFPSTSNANPSNVTYSLS